MSDPSDTNQAEIYVEVRLKNVSHCFQNYHQILLLRREISNHSPFVFNFVYLNYFFALLKGKRKLVEGFVRWCHRSDKKVGLNQKIDVINVSYDEEPTGLYDAFYCQIK